MRTVDIWRDTDSEGTFRLYPIGDLHLDHVAFNGVRFQRYAKWIMEDPYAVAVFVGDLCEGRSPEQQHFDAETVHPFFLKRLGHYYDAVAERSVKLLRPIVQAGVPLVMVRGNHDLKAQWQNLTRRVARTIGAHYLGDGGYIRINTGTDHAGVGGKKKRPARYATKVYATHGSGGGKTPGPKFNEMELGSRWLDADIIVKGHVHDAGARVISIIDVPVDGPIQLVERAKALLRAPAFVEFVWHDTDGYAIRQGYPTTDRGLLYLNVKPSERSIWRRECEF